SAEPVGASSPGLAATVNMRLLPTRAAHRAKAHGTVDRVPLRSPATARVERRYATCFPSWQFIRTLRVHDRLNHQRNVFMGYDCHIELIFKSWKSYLQLATLPTKTADSTLCYLYGRRLLILLIYGLCPALRVQLWTQRRRELSVL